MDHPLFVVGLRSQLIWAVVFHVCAGTNPYFDDPDATFLQSGRSRYYYGFGPYGVYSDSTLKLIALAFFTALQTYLTFGTHCAELIVNATRDESAWRKAARLDKRGASTDQNPVKAALTSWATLVLMVLKTVIHWAFGQAVSISFATNDWDMYANALFFLAELTFLLAAFATTLACWRRKGPQPATHGYIQTTIDLIDDWGETNNPIYWGDKGAVAGPAHWKTRHAGTASKPGLLGSIQMDAFYI